MKAKKPKVPDQTFWALLAVTASVALIIRIYRLGDIPNGLFCDEAANGYDAYSILKTGKNLYGYDMPLFLLHHGFDYVESLYTYLSIPFVALFGLTTFSTRLVAALAGTCTILTTSLLARELFNKQVGLIAAFLVAFSPWHIIFSRIAFRGVLLPLFITLGVYLFLKGLKNHKYFIPCGLIFGLSLHTYAVAKLFVPLLLLCLMLLKLKTITLLIKSNRKFLFHFLLASVVFVTLALPVYFFSFWGPGNQRFTTLSIFRDSHPVSLFVQNYLLHLTPNFLFFQGDPNPRHSLPGFGELMLVLIPFVILGIWIIFRQRSTAYLLPPIVFLLGIIPPALTNEGLPHALRAIGAFPFLEITAAVGINFIFNKLLQLPKRTGTILTGAIFVVLLSNAAMFTHAYFTKYSKTSQNVFQYGMEEAIKIAEKESDNYDHIFLSPNINQAYIFVLFFAKSDPAEYQKNRSLGKYIVNTRRVPSPGRYLFILHPQEHQSIKQAKYLIQGTDKKIFWKLFEYEVR